MDCAFTFLYQYHHEPGTFVEAHRHSCCELVYYLRGTGTITIGGDCLPYGENTFSVTVPGLDHSEEHTDATEVLFIGFTCDANPSPVRNGVHTDQDGAVLRLLEEMRRELTDRRDFFAPRLDLLAGETVIEYCRLAGVREAELTKGLPYIEKFINENLSRDIDLRTLADLAGYSYDHFRHLFKTETGCSPMSYILDRRLDRARQLLRATDRKIADVAYSCGFTSESFFCSLFRRRTGMTPGAYRAAGRGTSEI